ncbi:MULTISPECIES: hypothetical protein [Heliobacterium]|uniref:Uncharacterized protein n=1 Tax=Heliobacterium chlorum TaxID=2698 RepID=A0ABR7SZA9_HELCL|nr:MULTISPECIES: hypothetical protein [Heliobacterium]MBC9783869.1 hypothetical protein [Heliobacterium chlorum]
MAESNKPTIAPGDEDAALNARASRHEEQKGDLTKVTKLSWDEGDV